MGTIAVLLDAKALYRQSEPLKRRALAIGEAFLSKDHPTVAIRLNNLAQLLQATGRLAEAEPLMRRHLEIFLAFTRDTGHPHPHLNSAFRNYAGLLHAMGLGEAEVATRIEGLKTAAALARG